MDNLNYLITRKPTNELLKKQIAYYYFHASSNEATNGETRTFVIEAVGKHQLHATIDWCSSPLLTTIITSDENKKIVVDLDGDFSKNWSYFFYSGFSILILDFILSKTLHFPYALVLMVFPLLFMFYLLVFKQKIALQLSEIVNL
ncbi:hypothetical protein [Flavobacterium sp. NKUCC04_CG]|uniref:hypothetical protein n=1 Tax=Flavobacterium sp. NKUCC04_CG TaxID=2842121 RepID=UPI001C5A5CED|nr:hypothetical protein [Flavobacterium sp. NKUCC04_CG]MBW3518097.1 hypothetical protein [Flavobacterium sp. NKUCC04_CG]